MNLPLRLPWLLRRPTKQRKQNTAVTTSGLCYKLLQVYPTNCKWFILQSTSGLSPQTTSVLSYRLPVVYATKYQRFILQIESDLCYKIPVVYPTDYFFSLGHTNYQWFILRTTSGLSYKLQVVCTTNYQCCFLQATRGLFYKQPVVYPPNYVTDSHSNRPSRTRLRVSRKHIRLTNTAVAE